MKWISFLGLWIFPCLSLLANTDIRDWTLQNGKVIQAELVSYEPKSGKVILKLDYKKETPFQFEDFGTLDKAWLVEWTEFDAELQSKIKDMGGTFQHLLTTGTYPTDLFIYYPSTKKTAKASMPALILFHPGAKAARYLLRHMEAAEATGLIVISCGNFQNTYEKPEEDLFEARWKEVFPQILNRVEFDRKRLFMGGTSGGASRAFDFSTYTDYPWAGIYSNGGWLGGRENYSKPFAKNMRVVIVNGDSDKASNSWIKPDSEILQTRGCKVGVVAFEGAHQVPPVPTQIKAFNWLLGREEFKEE